MDHELHKGAVVLSGAIVLFATAALAQTTTPGATGLRPGHREAIDSRLRPGEPDTITNADALGVPDAPPQTEPLTNADALGDSDADRPAGAPTNTDALTNPLSSPGFEPMTDPILGEPPSPLGPPGNAPAGRLGPTPGVPGAAPGTAPGGAAPGSAPAGSGATPASPAAP